MKDSTGLKNSSRRALVLGAAAAVVTVPFPAAYAQAYPAKPIRWVVGYSAGGGLDMVARLLGDSMSRQLGQPIVVENRPGAAGMIAASTAASAPPDGYTLISLDVGTYALNPNLYSKVPYNSARDFAIVGMQVTIPFILFVNAALPVNNLAEFIAYVKSKPAGTVNYASTGIGGPVHLAMELLQEKAKLAMTHVPYKGSPAALADIIGGQVQAGFNDPASAMQHVTAGKLKALAVAMPKRLDAFPELPTFVENGHDVQIQVWVALGTNAGTPRPVIDKLNEVLLAALRDPEIAKRLASVGFAISSPSVDEASAFARKQLVDWEAFLKPRNIRLD